MRAPKRSTKLAPFSCSDLLPDFLHRQSASQFRWYDVALAGDEVRLAVAVMDNVMPPETLLRDDTNGWAVVRDLVTAMEEHQVRELTRPIEINEFAADGCDSSVIA